MDYEIVFRKAMTVAGLECQTKNSDPTAGAMIGKLWQDFYEGGIYTAIPEKQSDKSLGIYTGYVSGDADGAYTAIVACETTENASLPANVVKYTIPTGKYARFVVHGHMVQATVDFWHALWEMDLPRAFTYDFEEYQNNDIDNAEIHMYISLRDDTPSQTSSNAYSNSILFE